MKKGVLGRMSLADQDKIKEYRELPKMNDGPGLGWDEWFLEMCKTVAKKSQCLSRQIGAILVKDRSIISTGYNGPPRGVPHCGYRHKLDLELLAEYKRLDPHFEATIVTTTCPRYILGYKSGQGLDLCVAGHAERNTLINAARAGIKTKGCKLYMDCGVPCTPCLVEIINAGIEEIIVTKMVYYDRSAEYTLKNSDLKCRVYEHLKKPQKGSR
jgi:dCMP deaminase